MSEKEILQKMTILYMEAQMQNRVFTDEEQKLWDALEKELNAVLSEEDQLPL